MIAFIIECAKFNIPIQLFPMLKIAGLNCMIMGAFIGITLMLCVIFKHTAIVVVLCHCLLMVAYLYDDMG